MTLRRVSLSLSLLISIALFSWSLLKDTDAQTERSETIKVAVHAVPSVALVIAGGSDGQGRITTLTQGLVDFGNIVFIRPDLVKNGDGWLTDDFKVKLSSTFSVQTVFGGLRNVLLSASREGITEEPFRNLYYSTGIYRTDPEIDIPYSPTEQTIKTLESGETVTLRIIGVIDPTQKGRISDKIKLKAKGEEF